MIAYKFLSAGRVGLYSGVSWPEPGTWLAADADAKRCTAGIHALRPEGLLGWIDDELWTCELAGIVEDDGQVLVAERGRLLELMASWNESSARGFARACAARGREHVAEALRTAGFEAETRELDGLDVDEYVKAAAGLADRLPAELAGLVLVAADTTALAEGLGLAGREPAWRSHLEAVADGDPTYGAIAANVAFIVARWTAGLHPEGYEAGFAAERAWQLERLVERLGLAVPAN